MNIEFDASKDRVNVAKHAVSLARAVDFEMLAVKPDDRFSYGERRFRTGASSMALPTVSPSLFATGAFERSACGARMPRR